MLPGVTELVRVAGDPDDDEDEEIPLARALVTVMLAGRKEVTKVVRWTAVTVPLVLLADVAFQDRAVPFKSVVFQDTVVPFDSSATLF
jgi:hypothetical protein